MPSDIDSPLAWLRRSAVAHKNRPALVLDKMSFDYESLYARVGRMAAHYLAAGLEAERPVAVLSSRAERIAWASYVAFYCGCPLLPLDPRRPRREDLIEQCGVRQVLSDTHTMPCGPKQLPWVEDCTNQSPISPKQRSSDAVQLYIATSGTTSEPRAAMLTGTNLTASAQGSLRRLGLEAGDVWLNCLPLFHIGGFSILLRCMQAGATVLLHDGFDAARVWKDVQERHVTHVSLVPGMLARLLDQSEDSTPPPSLRRVLIGGGRLSTALVRRAKKQRWPLCVTYGMTETASHVTLQCELDDQWCTGNSGQAVPGARLEIVDAQGELTSGVGQVRIVGPMVMAGYANADHKPGDGLSGSGFTSGDLGKLNSRGCLKVIGRSDDVLVSGGVNVNPLEVEELMSDCPGVEDVAVTGRPDPIWGDRIIAVVVSSSAHERMRRWCRDNLPEPLRPRVLVKVERLPRDSLGKLQRHALAALIEESQYASPSFQVTHSTPLGTRG